MKRFLFLMQLVVFAAGLLIGCTTFTQPKLGVTITADHRSPTGYFVTFVYFNPNATLVELGGNMMLMDFDNLGSFDKFPPHEYRPGLFPAAMIRRPPFFGVMDSLGNGYWTLTVPLTGGGIAYWFHVYEEPNPPANPTAAQRAELSLRIGDPANPPPLSPGDNRSIVNTQMSVAHVPWDSQRQHVLNNRDLELPRTDGRRGTVQFVPYYANNTETDWGRQYLGVYLPYGFDANRAEPYPVLFLSHGVGGDQTDWMGAGGAPNIFDNLIAEGRIVPTVVVSMNNNAFAFTMAQIDDKHTPAAENMIYNILPFVEENFNVSSNPEQRAFAGLSMGAALTTTLFHEYTTEFGYFGIFGYAGNMDNYDFANLENKTFPTIFFGYGFFGDWYEMFYWRFPAAMEAAGIAHSYHPVPA
ncbi:MAG: alpha/beta hydrolase-fold protein, partial [Treponema sp.]|nr:alpha/beta hydrolase-fold protein [Treponema sp.]